MPEKMILTEEEEKKICDLYQSGMGFRKILRTMHIAYKADIAPEDWV